MKQIIWITMISAILIGCSDDNGSEAKTEAKAESFLKGQQELLDKAKALDQQLQEAAEAQKREIEEQSQ